MVGTDYFHWLIKMSIHERPPQFIYYENYANKKQINLYQVKIQSGTMEQCLRTIDSLITIHVSAFYCYLCSSNVVAWNSHEP